jgi:hypothetical protein
LSSTCVHLQEDWYMQILWYFFTHSYKQSVRCQDVFDIYTYMYIRTDFVA